jgi:cytoskeletal protein CcmA (bactofilin family)
MKPVCAKNEVVHFGVAASSAAWGWRNSRSGAAIPKSFGFEAATRPSAPAQRVATKNSRPGVAILVVLFVIMVATIISLSFIARSDVELAFGKNMALRLQMDYLAESGLAHAKAMITHPQDAATDPNVFWSGVEGFSLKDLDFYGLLETGDYYDVVVTRDPTDRCNYDITCRAYHRLDDETETAQSYLKARLRLDPCIAYWAGASTPVSSQITVNGDVYCSGTLTNSGTINGDVHSLGLAGSGTVEGRWYDIGLSPLDDIIWPDLSYDDFTPQYYFWDEINEVYVAYTPEFPAPGDDIEIGTDPAGVIVYNGQLILNQDVSINGTLIVNGDLILNGNSLTITTSEKNFPALVVNGDPNVASGQLTVTGLVQVGTMSVGAAAGDITITGALVAQGGMTVLPGYTGNITITAGPMIASTKISPDGSSTANVKRWTPIGGAFFKWIKRE